MRFLFLALLLSIAQLQAENVVKVPTPGTLSTLLTQLQKDTCTQLTVQGKLNSADIKVLRQMAGYKEEGCSTGVLSTLNLADAEFVTDKEPYMVLDAVDEHLSTMATPGKISEMRYRMGEPFTESHKIRYDKYRHENWRDYSNMRWNPVGQVYVPRYELMTFYSKSVAYYYAKFILGTGTASDMRPKDKQFQFSSNLDEDYWKWLKKEGLTHVRGHRIVKDGDRYLLYVNSHKEFLPTDMFHDCDRLQFVVLPKKMKVDNSLVIDETSTITYRLPWDEMAVYYRSRQKCYDQRRSTGSLGYYEEAGDKKTVVYDASSTNLYKVLKELAPAKPAKNYVPNIRAALIINYADGRKPERYDIDSDMKHVVVNGDSLYLKVNDDLLHELKQLNISTQPYVKPLPKTTQPQNQIVTDGKTYLQIVNPSPYSKKQKKRQS